ncbi:MAG TPA: c-type cytochrome [Bryobacteraceae bacterium]
MRILRIATLGAATASLLLAADIVGDARRGEQIFENQRCIQCHSINGRGGTAAPDLGKHIARELTPAAMAALMWNHAPQMWSAMRQAGIAKGTLSEQSAADLFAYFTAARFFEKPGDAARGKQAFSELHCADCHGITDSKAAGAPPVMKWESLTDTAILVDQMWQHGPRMRQAYADHKVKWSPITGQQLNDILVYLKGLPETRSLASVFELPSHANGAQLFQSKGCANCHTGKLALETRLRDQTLTDVAADMWNHQAAMKQAPELSADEMRQILAYIWMRPRFEGSGDASHGKKVFAEKGCAECHTNGAGAPNLGKIAGGYSDISIVSALWDHGPRMLELMDQRKIPWPRFTAREMSNLIAYLNSLATNNQFH